MGISFAKRNTKKFNGNLAVDGVVRLERNAQCNDKYSLIEYLVGLKDKFKTEKWAIAIYDKKGGIVEFVQPRRKEE